MLITYGLIGCILNTFQNGQYAIYFFFLAEGHYMSITMTFFKKLILVIDDFRIG